MLTRSTILENIAVESSAKGMLRSALLLLLDEEDSLLFLHLTSPHGKEVLGFRFELSRDFPVQRKRRA